MTPELEQKIRKRIDWQESKLQNQRRDFGPNSQASMRTEAYIAALKWVLEIANV
jgi:hypothetical protein